MGTVSRSSQSMSRKMSEFIDTNHDVIIVELGAGDGVITKHILDKMSPKATLFVFEINPELCEMISKIKDERMILINDGAQYMQIHLEKHGFDHADHIISALPFTILPHALTKEILKISHQMLKKYGLFIQMHYSKTKIDMYQSIFSKVVVSYVPLNIPPGYVFKCVKDSSEHDQSETKEVKCIA
jgi:phospholipid N-methyltransferase